jgi:phosphatidylinositol-bisphosphatase
LDLPSCTPHSLCDTLTRFIAALPQPLLPLELYPTVSAILMLMPRLGFHHLPFALQIEIDAANLKAFSKRFLDDLPPLSYNVFVYILSFLREVLSESNYNR